jgi:hypothetical protein
MSPAFYTSRVCHHAEGIFMLVIWTGKPASMEVLAPGRVPYLPLSGVLESTVATHA